MIRPITILCALAACASGYYVYQSKHRVHVLDSQIENIVHQTATLGARTRMLQAEWMVLNDPQRLQALASQLLTLKPVAPGQFTTMADLDARLPPVGPPPADAVAPVDPGAATDGPTVASIMTNTPAVPAGPGPTAPGPIVQAQAASSDHAPMDRAVTDRADLDRTRTLSGHGAPADRQVSPHLASAVPIAPLPHALSPHPAPFRPAVVRSTTHPSPSHSSPARPAYRPAAPSYARVERHAPIARPPAPRPAAPPLGGSLLGMAHAGLAPPVPVAAPVAGPVSQAAWTSDR